MYALYRSVCLSESLDLSVTVDVTLVRIEKHEANTPIPEEKKYEKILTRKKS